MTIALSLRVNEGCVLAADSASTAIARLPNGANAVINVYNNANKIFNLRKGCPIGAITWGAGNIGEWSISMLMKELRSELTASIDPANYQMKDVAEQVKQFIFDDRYDSGFATWNPKPTLGFIVAGYSTGAALAEEYQIDMTDGVFSGPQILREGTAAGATWNGQIEAITRLLVGFSPLLPMVVQQVAELPDEKMVEVVNTLQGALNPQILQEGLPLQDAIDLATFLVDVAIKFSQFSPGAPVVGGPIEVAAISKYEGFKWVARKHYYVSELNPPIEEA